MLGFQLRRVSPKQLGMPLRTMTLNSWQIHNDNPLYFMVDHKLFGGFSKWETPKIIYSNINHLQQQTNQFWGYPNFVKPSFMVTGDGSLRAESPINILHARNRHRSVGAVHCLWRLGMKTQLLLSETAGCPSEHEEPLSATHCSKSPLMAGGRAASHHRHRRTPTWWWRRCARCECWRPPDRLERPGRAPDTRSAWRSRSCGT